VTTASAHKITITPEQFARLARVIYERSGIHFVEAKKYILESRLSHRLSELEMDDFDQYISYLTMGPYQMDEFQEMFNRITINETSFFRNEAQLEVFEDRVLPGLLEARAATKRLRVWSAACSSGEEPFTLAMLIHRTLGVRLADWHIEILGTDISEKVLHVAQSGVYNDYAMRSTPQLVRDRYFVKEGRNHRINDEIRQMVSFEVLNLKDRMAAKRHGTWDIIFCRNVLIYFDDGMKQSVVKMFENQLADDGVLFIGHSERIKDLDVNLTPLSFPQGFCYEKSSHIGS